MSWKQQYILKSVASRAWKWLYLQQTNNQIVPLIKLKKILKLRAFELLVGTNYYHHFNKITQQATDGLRRWIDWKSDNTYFAS